MNIKRWLLAGLLAMAGCGSRVAYAMDLNANFATPVEVQSPVSLKAGTTVAVSTTGATPQNVVVNNTVAVSTTGPSPQNAILNSGTLTGALPAGTNKIGGADVTGQVSSITVVAVAGSTCTTAASVSVPATGITQILATNAGRFHGEILNTSTTNLWVPQATTTAENGMKVGPGATFTWDSISPLYGVSGTGTIQVLTLDVTK